MQLDKEVDQYLSEKRSIKEERKRKRRWKEQKGHDELKGKVKLAFGGRSKIISMLSNSYRGNPFPNKGRLTLSIPSIFSIIENPTVAIGVVGQFAKTLRQTTRPTNIYLDYSQLQHYDLAANALLDLVSVEFKKETNKNRRRTRWQGVFPKSPEHKKFIRALGIIKHLHLTHEYLDAEEEAELRIFDVRNRHYYRVDKPSKVDLKSKVVAGFSNHINQCLGDYNLELTPEALHKLCVYTGEILDNAEQHAEMVDWSIQGYLDNSCETPICEIAIFNFGKTIAETLSKLPKEGYTWKQIAPYIRQHRRRKFFGESWAETDLLTLIALQGNVSSKNNAPSDTRGNGTVELIEFFQKVHEECAPSSPIKATMAILSGSTHILFDGTYKLSNATDGPRRIAFNSGNDLNALPDSKYVRGLKSFHFPGTIISIRFPMSATSINEIISDQNIRNGN